MSFRKSYLFTLTAIILSFASVTWIGCSNDSSASLATPRAFGPTVPPTTGAESCAQQIILSAAKTNVANVYGNRPESGGDCALGVRQSLQLSGVGGISGGIGNAIDYLANLPPYGFIDSGLRDPNKAIPGSVIVFAGPDSASYLQTGKYGTPAGDWLGHVTIKGDDGYYYTDARTVEPAIGWENGVNVVGERDVAGIFVPNAALAGQYAGKCSTLTITQIRAPLAVAVASTPVMVETGSTKDFQNLNYQNPADQIVGHRLMPSVVSQMQQFTQLPPTNPNRSSVFHDLLTLGREAIPYDGEGQFTKILAMALRGDSRLQSQFDQYIQTMRVNDPAPCKTKRMTTAINEVQCLVAAGIAGQDFAGLGPDNDGRSCVSNFNYLLCLNETGH